MAVSKIVTRVCSLLNIIAKHGAKHEHFFSPIISEKRFLLADFYVSWVRFLVQIDSRLMCKAGGGKLAESVVTSSFWRGNFHCILK